MSAYKEAAMQDSETHGADIDVLSEGLADEALDRDHGSGARFTNWMPTCR